MLATEYYTMICTTLYSFQTFLPPGSSKDTLKDPMREARSAFLSTFRWENFGSWKDGNMQLVTKHVPSLSGLSVYFYLVLLADSLIPGSLNKTSPFLKLFLLPFAQPPETVHQFNQNYWAIKLSASSRQRSSTVNISMDPHQWACLPLYWRIMSNWDPPGARYSTLHLDQIPNLLRN